MLSVESPTTYYTATRKYDLKFPDLEHEIDTEVVIIGGGFSGVNTALELTELGVRDIVLLEARYLGFGGSGRNGGHVMAGIGHDLEKIRKSVGDDGLKAIFEISDLGATIIRERIAKYNIDADYQHGYGYMGFNKRQARLLQAWEKEFKALNPGQDIEFLEGHAVHSIIGSEYYSCALKHMGNGHIHSLNMLLGSAKALVEMGVRIFENTPALQVTYGDTITVRTAKGVVRAKKILWSCGAFLDRMESYLHERIINTYAYQLVTEPLPHALIEQISPIRGAFSDIRPVIDYYRVTQENRLLFGSATKVFEYIPSDLKAWNRRLMLNVFPYLEDVKIDLAWGGPMECTSNLFPQIGTLPGQRNAFFVQGYSGFGVTPSHVVSRVVAQGMCGGSRHWDVMSSIKPGRIVGKDSWRNMICSLGKISHQLVGYTSGRR